MKRRLIERLTKLAELYEAAAPRQPDCRCVTKECHREAMWDTAEEFREWASKIENGVKFDRDPWSNSGLEEVLETVNQDLSFASSFLSYVDIKEWNEGRYLKKPYPVPVTVDTDNQRSKSWQVLQGLLAREKVNV